MCFKIGLPNPTRRVLCTVCVQAKYHLLTPPTSLMIATKQSVILKAAWPQICTKTCDWHVYGMFVLNRLVDQAYSMHTHAAGSLETHLFLVQRALVATIRLR